MTALRSFSCVPGTLPGPERHRPFPTSRRSAAPRASVDSTPCQTRKAGAAVLVGLGGAAGVAAECGRGWGGKAGLGTLRAWRGL